MELETFKKLPLGGVDRRAMVTALAEGGPAAAREQLRQNRAELRPSDTRIAKDAAIVVLGGSNGITRALVIQLLFGERANIYSVHLDSEKMQIGPHHVAAISEAAAAEGLTAKFLNADATKPAVIEQVANELKDMYRCVHVINGIAAGATKRYKEHGPTLVKDIDVAFDAVLQTPDFSKPENIRRVGLVEVEVATDVDIERTNKSMGSSSLLWVEPLAARNLIVANESLVGFCDYDYPPIDPVYAMGPLAGAKILQRETMKTIHERWAAKTARICYPAVGTTALGAIPGGLLQYGLTAQMLKERGEYQNLMELAHHSMAIFRDGYDSQDVRIDTGYQKLLPEFFARRDALRPEDVPGAFHLLYER